MVTLYEVIVRALTIGSPLDHKHVGRLDCVHMNYVTSALNAALRLTGLQIL
jgi:hypothetical protein